MSDTVTVTVNINCMDHVDYGSTPTHRTKQNITV